LTGISKITGLSSTFNCWSKFHFFGNFSNLSIYNPVPSLRIAEYETFLVLVVSDFIGNRKQGQHLQGRHCSMALANS